MNVKDIAGFRTWSLDRETPDFHDEHFIGHSHPTTSKWGYFKIKHGQKPDIAGFLHKEVQMAEDGQAIYEFIQNAADCDATHFWLFFDDEQFIVINNGTPFTTGGMSSILNVGQSEGKKSPGKIGRFGIGFKLVHRLVGEDSGLPEMMNEYAGPVLFSWSQPAQFQQFCQPGEPVIPVQYDHVSAMAGTGDPWLLKILLTCFPALPAEPVRDLAYQERVVFTAEELRSCRSFLARHAAHLPPELFAQGSMTYLRLGKGKSHKLREEESLLRRGVANSMHFLGRLQYIQLQNQPVERFNDLSLESFSLPVDSVERVRIPLTDPRDLASPIDLHFGFAPVEQAEAALRDEPTFYKYFPAGDETAPYTFILHSNVISVESNRRKLHDNSVNQALLKLAADLLTTRLGQLALAGDKGPARKVWAGLVLSGPPIGSHAWQRSCFYNPLLEAAQQLVPTELGFALPAQVKIKRTALPVCPGDFGLKEEWFYWAHGTEPARQAASKEKINLDVWEIEHLLPRCAQAEPIQRWLNQLEPDTWPLLREELALVPLTAWQGGWTRSEDKSTFTLFQRFGELELFNNAKGTRRVSLNALCADPQLLLLTSVNPADQAVFEALGFDLFLLEDQWRGAILTHIRKQLPWLDDTQKRVGSQELLQRISQRLLTATLTATQKHRLLAWLAALPELGIVTLRQLALFRNAAGEIKPLNELVGPAVPLPEWAQFAQLHAADDAPALAKYLLQPDELYSHLVQSRWAWWLTQISAGMIGSFCRSVVGWFGQATDKLPLSDTTGALTATGWLSSQELFYHKSLSTVSSFEDAAITLEELYGLSVPVKAMLPWLEHAPFRLEPDQVAKLHISQPVTLTSSQLSQLLYLAAADAATLALLQVFTIQAQGSRFLLTPRNVDGKPVPYFSANKPLVAYLSQTVPDFHQLPADKLLSGLQPAALRDDALYQALLDYWSNGHLLDDEVIRLVAESDMSSVQKVYLARLPEIEFELADSYRPDSSDLLLLQLAANPQLLPVEERPKFRRRLSLNTPDSVFPLDGAAENDAVLISAGEEIIRLSRAMILPGADQRHELVNTWADRLGADAALRDLLGLSAPPDLVRLQTELLSELKPFANAVQNAAQLAFVLLTARYASAPGTKNLLSQVTAADVTGEQYTLAGCWYLSAYSFIEPSYILAPDLSGPLPELLGFDKKQRRWAVTNTDFELLRQPYFDREGFYCPGLRADVDPVTQEALIDFLYNRWLRAVQERGSNEWPSDWTVIASQPAESAIGFVPAVSIAASGLSLAEENLPAWVSEWSGRNSPDQRNQFLYALGVSGPASAIAELRKAFRSAPDGEPYALFNALSSGSATHQQLLTNTLLWLQQAEIKIASTWHQAVLTELYKRLPPGQFTADVLTYLTEASDERVCYRVLPCTNDVLLLSQSALTELAGHSISMSQLIQIAKPSGYTILDLAVYPTAWQDDLEGQEIAVEFEFDRAKLQDNSTEVYLPQWQDASNATVRTYPDLLPKLRTLLGHPLPDLTQGVFWTDSETNNVYVTAAHLSELPTLLASDPDMDWPATELELLRQDLLQHSTSVQLLTSQTELQSLRTEVEQLRLLLEQHNQARDFAAGLPSEPSAHKQVPLSKASESVAAQASEEAKAAVRELLEQRGYDCLKWHASYTTITGVTYRGQAVPIVVKSAAKGVLYLNPNEWLHLASSPHAQLFAVQGPGKVYSVRLDALELRNQQFFMQFDVGDHVVQGIEAFANFFRYLPYKTHFVFDVPGFSSSEDFYQTFGLHQRKSPVPGEVQPHSLSILD